MLNIQYPQELQAKVAIENVMCLFMLTLFFITLFYRSYFFTHQMPYDSSDSLLDARLYIGHLSPGQCQLCGVVVGRSARGL